MYTTTPAEACALINPVKPSRSARKVLHSGSCLVQHGTTVIWTTPSLCKPVRCQRSVSLLCRGGHLHLHLGVVPWSNFLTTWRWLQACSLPLDTAKVRLQLQSGGNKYKYVGWGRGGQQPTIPLTPLGHAQFQGLARDLCNSRARGGACCTVEGPRTWCATVHVTWVVQQCRPS